MEWVNILLALFLADLVTVLAGNAGAYLPLLSVCVFYYTAKYGCRKMFLVSLTAASLLDAVWMHRFPGEGLGVLLLLGSAAWWRKFGDLGSLASLWSGGGIVGVCGWLGCVLAGCLGGTSGAGPGWLLKTCVARVVLSLLLTPVAVWLLSRRGHSLS